MSFSDIVQFVGTKSVPFVVAGTVYGVFETGEKLASQRAKDALSKWLLSFDVQKAKGLPDGTREIFERIFGERHFTLKCFIRSVMFSLGALAFISIIVVLIDPKEALIMAKKIVSKPGFADWVLFIPWFPLSIMLDYISLFKTRVILRALIRMIRRDKIIIPIAILSIDYMIYVLLFLLISMLIVATVFAIEVVPRFANIGIGFHSIFNLLFYDVSHVTSFIIYWPNIKSDQLFFIFFWTGFAPSLWMWLYVFALFATRTILRSEKLINWLRWFLDVEKTPFRSIGAVAAALVFIASVAILLVSAVISRIIAAT